MLNMCKKIALACVWLDFCWRIALMFTVYDSDGFIYLWDYLFTIFIFISTSCWLSFLNSYTFDNVHDGRRCPIGFLFVRLVEVCCIRCEHSLSYFHASTCCMCEHAFSFLLDAEWRTENFVTDYHWFLCNSAFCAGMLLFAYVLAVYMYRRACMFVRNTRLHERWRLKVCSKHMNWTELACNKSTRWLVTRVSVTTWLAAAKLGRLVLSQFMRCDCEHSRWNREGLWCSFRLWTSTKRTRYSTCSELGSVQFSSVRVLWANLKFVSLRSPRECWSRYVLSVCDVIVLVVITTKSSLSSATNT